MNPTLPLDKQFTELADQFILRGWTIKTNNMNEISFSYLYDYSGSGDEFNIKVDQCKIIIVMPLLHSSSSYRTEFNDLTHATTYIVARLIELTESYR